MDTVNVTEQAAPVFVFKAQEYRLDALKAQLPGAPLVELSTADLNPFGVGEGPFQVQFPAGAMEGPGEEVTFFRQEGKFTVLLGQASVQDQFANGATHVRGRIISGPALKRARIDSPFVDEPVPCEPVPIEAPARTRARKTDPSRAGQRRWRPNPPPHAAAGDRARSATARAHKGG